MSLIGTVYPDTKPFEAALSSGYEDSAVVRLIDAQNADSTLVMRLNLRLIQDRLCKKGDSAGFEPLDACAALLIELDKYQRSCRAQLINMILRFDQVRGRCFAPWYEARLIEQVESGVRLEDLVQDVIRRYSSLVSMPQKVLPDEDEMEWYLVDSSSLLAIRLAIARRSKLVGTGSREMRVGKDVCVTFLQSTWSSEHADFRLWTNVLASSSASGTTSGVKSAFSFLLFAGDWQTVGGDKILGNLVSTTESEFQQHIFGLFDSSVVDHYKDRHAPEALGGSHGPAEVSAVSCETAGRPSHVQPPSSRLDLKSLMANERTFLSWFNVCSGFGSFGGLYGLLPILGASLGFLWSAVFYFILRFRAISNASNDKTGQGFEVMRSTGVSLALGSVTWLCFLGVLFINLQELTIRELS